MYSSRAHLTVHHSVRKEFSFWLKCLFFNALYSKKKLSSLFKYLLIILKVQTSLYGQNCTRNTILLVTGSFSLSLWSEAFKAQGWEGGGGDVTARIRNQAYLISK